MTVVKSSQPLKALSPILTVFSGIVISVIPLWLNTLFASISRVDGSSISSRELQQEKA